MFKGFLIQDKIGTERVQQDKQVMTAKLDWSSGQKDSGFRMVTEKPDRIVIGGVLVSDVVRLVYNNQIETRGRV